MPIDNRFDRRTPAKDTWGVPDIVYEADSQDHPAVTETKTQKVVDPVPEYLSPHPNTDDFPNCLLTHRKTSAGNNVDQNLWLSYETLPGAEVVSRTGNGSVIEETVRQPVVAGTEPGVESDDRIAGQSTTVAERTFTRWRNPDGTAASSPILGREYYDPETQCWPIEYRQIKTIFSVPLVSVTHGSPAVIRTTLAHGLVTGDKVDILNATSKALATATPVTAGSGYILSAATPANTTVITLEGGTHAARATVKPARVCLTDGETDGGGSGFAIGDTIDLGIMSGAGTVYTAARIRVTGVIEDGFANAFEIVSNGSYSNSDCDLYQSSSSGAGTGFSLMGEIWGIVTATVVATGEYATTPDTFTQASSTTVGASGATFTGTFTSTSSPVNGLGRTVTKITDTTFSVAIATTVIAGDGWERGPIPQERAIMSTYGTALSQDVTGATIVSAAAYVIYSEIRDIDGSPNKLAVWTVMSTPPSTFTFKEESYVFPGRFSIAAGAATLTISSVLLATLLPGLTGYGDTYFVTRFSRPQAGYDFDYIEPRPGRFMAKVSVVWTIGPGTVLAKFYISSSLSGSRNFRVQDQTLSPAFQWIALLNPTYTGTPPTAVASFEDILGIEKFAAATYPAGSNTTQSGSTTAYAVGDKLVVDAWTERYKGTNFFRTITVTISETESY